MAKNDLILYNFRFTDMSTGALIRYPNSNEMLTIKRIIEDGVFRESRELPDTYAQRITKDSEATLEWDSRLT